MWCGVGTVSGGALTLLGSGCSTAALVQGMYTTGYLTGGGSFIAVSLNLNGGYIQGGGGGPGSDVDGTTTGNPLITVTNSFTCSYAPSCVTSNATLAFPGSFAGASNSAGVGAALVMDAGSVLQVSSIQTLLAWGGLSLTAQNGGRIESSNGPSFLQAWTGIPTCSILAGSSLHLGAPLRLADPHTSLIHNGTIEIAFSGTNLTTIHRSGLVGWLVVVV